MKQFTKEEWLFWFQKYEINLSNLALDDFWDDLFVSRGLDIKSGDKFWMMTNLKSRFIAKYVQFKKLSDNNFMKKLKKSKGRKRINENNVQIKDERANKVIDELDEDKVRNLLKFFIKRERDRLTVDDARDLVDELEEHTETKIKTKQAHADLLGISRRSLNNEIVPKEKLRKGEEHLVEIRKLAVQFHRIYGRGKLKAELVKVGIFIAESQLGVILRENVLNSIAKPHKGKPKPAEPKDTKVDTENLIKDLVDTNKHWIVALDVSYIQGSKKKYTASS